MEENLTNCFVYILLRKRMLNVSGILSGAWQQAFRVATLEFMPIRLVV
jgi:hypothetical protein